MLLIILIINLIDECEDSSDFLDIMERISTIIEGSIIPIAAKLFAKSIIADAEYDMISDPSAEHSVAVTRTVLKATRRAIKSNPAYLKMFQGILLSMDQPISLLAGRIGKK